MTKTSSIRNFLLRFKIPLILIGMLLLAVIGILASPYSPIRMCTLMGCTDSLKITLSAEPTQTYEVLVTAPTGESRSVSCSPGESEPSYTSSSGTMTICDHGTITFMNFSPKQVIIKITWSSGSYTATGLPAYEAFRPNGRYCPPECSIGKLQVSLP